MKEINRFIAQSDNGEKFTIIELQSDIDVGHFDDPNARIPGSKKLITSEGDIVTLIDTETFKIVETDQIIRKIE